MSKPSSGFFVGEISLRLSKKQFHTHLENKCVSTTYHFEETCQLLEKTITPLVPGSGVQVLLFLAHLFSFCPRIIPFIVQE